MISAKLLNQSVLFGVDGPLIIQVRVVCVIYALFSDSVLAHQYCVAFRVLVYVANVADGDGLLVVAIAIADRLRYDFHVTHLLVLDRCALLASERRAVPGVGHVHLLGLVLVIVAVVIVGLVHARQCILLVLQKLLPWWNAKRILVRRCGASSIQAEQLLDVGRLLLFSLSTTGPRV